MFPFKDPLGEIKLLVLSNILFSASPEPVGPPFRSGFYKQKSNSNWLVDLGQ